jgi:hypothetical protein
MGLVSYEVMLSHRDNLHLFNNKKANQIFLHKC